jgi:hypothetical protein
MKLAVAAALLTGAHASAGFRAGSVARFAEFLARHANFGGQTSGGFLETQLHVVAQIGAALRSSARTPASAAGENILEAKKIASENILKLLEDGFC